MTKSAKKAIKPSSKLALDVTARHVWLACLGVLARVRRKLGRKRD